MARLSYKENPEAVIDKLLEYHSIEDLRAIINRKARRKARRGNNFFEVAVEVYVRQKYSKSKQIWAVDKVAERRDSTPKTVLNHITKFRNELKSRFEELRKDPRYNISEYVTFETFLERFIEEIHNELLESEREVQVFDNGQFDEDESINSFFSNMRTEDYERIFNRYTYDTYLKEGEFPF